MRTFRPVARCAAVLIFVLGAATLILAQGPPKTWNGGGTVKDPKGNPVRGVTMSIAESKTPAAILHHAMTDASGNFSFTDLDGNKAYVVAAEKGSGYKMAPASGSINWTHTKVTFTATKTQ